MHYCVQNVSSSEVGLFNMNWLLNEFVWFLTNTGAFYGKQLKISPIIKL